MSHTNDPSTAQEGTGGRQTASTGPSGAQDVQAATGAADGRVEPQPFWVRLGELSRLEDGWLDGQGKAPVHEALAAAARIVDALPAAIGPVRIYPTEPGGVQLEWDDANGQHSIDIRPDLHLYLFTHEPKETP